MKKQISKKKKNREKECDAENFDTTVADEPPQSKTLWALPSKTTLKYSAQNSSIYPVGSFFMCDGAAPNSAVPKPVIPPRVCETKRHLTRKHATVGEPQE